MVKSFVIIILYLISLYQLNAKMEPKIFGGETTNIENYPHSAYMKVLCGPRHWECGSSIFNRKIILTAAHCLRCSYSKMSVIISYGNENRNKGFQRSGERWVSHERYEDTASNNDIALVLMKKELRFSAQITHVLIMKRPPKDKIAYVAGWGLYDVNKVTSSKQLKHIKQKVWSRAECSTVIRHLPIGTICGGEKSSRDYLGKGDSGSALVIRKHIQIGIVSYKIESINNSLAVYTDTAYHHGWIYSNSRKLYI